MIVDQAREDAPGQSTPVQLRGKSEMTQSKKAAVQDTSTGTEKKKQVRSRIKGEKTKSEILAATHAVLLETFGEEPSVTQIAARASANVALINYHFTNKDGLFFELLHDLLLARLEELRELIEADMDPLERIRLHIEKTIRYISRYPYLQRITTRVVLHGPEEHARYIDEDCVTPIVHAYCKIVEMGIEAGKIRPLDPIQTYYTIVGACDHMIVSLHGLRGRIFNEYYENPAYDRSVEKLVHHTTEILLHGMVADE